jgi:hypothetical protein
MSQQSIIVGLSAKYTELLTKYQHVVNKYYAEKEIMTYVCNQQYQELDRITLELNELKIKYEELQLVHNAALVLSKIKK